MQDLRICLEKSLIASCLGADINADDRHLLIFPFQMMAEIYARLISQHGMLIMGDIIKRGEYYDKLIAVMGDPTASINMYEETAKMIAEHFSSMLTTFKDAANEPDESGKQILPNRIHLKNVHMTDASGRPIPLINALWRGKLESVDGFILGKPEANVTKSNHKKR